jgi:dihydrofolate reductase
MIISIIVALGENNEIGFRNGLPWRLPADLKHFKKLTTGHPVVMGRKTFESLPNGPLPNRENIVLSRNPDFIGKGYPVFSSLEKALIKLSPESEVFIIGGSQIYRQALPFANKLFLTRVHAFFPEADTFFPEIDSSLWLKRNELAHPADDRHAYSFTFYEYEKKKMEEMI